MKKLLGAAFFVEALVAQPALAQTVTVFYQPTPYPLKKADGSAMPTDIAIEHFWEGWFGSVYNKTLVEGDGTLQIGGWGDTYVSVLRFDLTGLPATVTNAILYLWALPSGAQNPSQVSIFPITSAWNPTTIGWNSWPQLGNGYPWPVSTAVNTWRTYDIMSFYKGWKGEFAS